MASTFLSRSAAGSWLLTGLVALSACRDASQTPDSPDVVLVLVDTLRADFTELGGRAGTSPNLADLERESVVFEEACSAAPWTLPSVASLFTGRHLVEHGVVHDRLQLPDEATTLAELLARRGYLTGSFHRNPFAGERFGLHQGFAVAEQRDTCTGARELEGFWSRAGARPYFLYVHNTEPHDLLVIRERFRKEAAQEFLDEYGRLVSEYRALTRVDFAAGKPLGTTDNTSKQQRKMARLDELLPQVHALYEASVRDADDRIGSIVEALRDRGSWERTLFIVVSDHGEEMGEHGGWQHDQSVYQELVHVPLLVRFPGGRFGGRRVRAPVSIVDLFPTILEVVGTSPEGLGGSGISLLSLLEDESPEDRPRLVAMRHNEKKYYRPFKESRGDINLAVRQGRWKAILNVETDTVELFDLAEDPGETRNLSGEHSERAAALATFAAERYAELSARADAPTAGGVEGGGEDVLRALQELGYLGEEGR